MTGRILADLGAEVVQGRAARRRPAAAGAARRARRHVAALRRPGTRARPASRSSGPDDPRLAELLAGADVVLDHAGVARRPRPSTRPGPRAPCGCSVTPFGRDGPRSRLAGERPRRHGVDREHVLHGRPRPGPGALHRAHGVVARRARGGHGRAHRAGLGAAPGGRRLGPGGGDDRLDGPRRAGSPGPSNRGKRSGASIGITREIWPCADGFVSFGLRGGKARVTNMQTITRLVAEDGLAHTGAHRAGLDDLRPQPRRAPRSSTPSPRPSPSTSCATPWPSSTRSRWRPTSCSPRPTRPAS